MMYACVCVCVQMGCLQLKDTALPHPAVPTAPRQVNLPACVGMSDIPVDSIVWQNVFDVMCSSYPCL